MRYNKRMLISMFLLYSLVSLKQSVASPVDDSSQRIATDCESVKQQSRALPHGTSGAQLDQASRDGVRARDVEVTAAAQFAEGLVPMLITLTAPRSHPVSEEAISIDRRAQAAARGVEMIVHGMQQATCDAATWLIEAEAAISEAEASVAAGMKSYQDSYAALYALDAMGAGDMVLTATRARILAVAATLAETILHTFDAATAARDALGGMVKARAPCFVDGMCLDLNTATRLRAMSLVSRDEATRAADSVGLRAIRAIASIEERLQDVASAPEVTFLRAGQITRAASIARRIITAVRGLYPAYDDRLVAARADEVMARASVQAIDARIVFLESRRRSGFYVDEDMAEALTDQVVARRRHAHALCGKVAIEGYLAKQDKREDRLAVL